MTFENLGIKPEIVQGLRDHNIVKPTSIQEKIIPRIAQGIDVVGISKTGSGKTLAFMAPILNNLGNEQGIKALIVVPTRELAEQIKNEIFKFGKYTRQNVTAIYGGVSINPQYTALKHADIVIGTPGRLCDHIQRNSINLRNIKHLVLDEADRMVSMGFIEDVERIIQVTPNTRQFMLFGATLGSEIIKLQRKYMKNPETIGNIQQIEQSYLAQTYYQIEENEKFSLLVHLINKENPTLGIVFCSTRRMADAVSRNLRMQKVNAQVIHGGMTQNRRLQVLDSFHKGKTVILVATELAARGLDIKNVTHIFNYNLPRNPEDYIHRVGRTARAGESGKAITLLAPSDFDAMRAIEGRYPIKVQRAEREDFQRIPFMSGRRDNQSGRFDNRNRPNRDNQQRRFGNRNRFNRTSDGSYQNRR